MKCRRTYEIVRGMKLGFQARARIKRYDTSGKYFAYKMEENSSASEHVFRMSGHYNRLNRVGVDLPDEIVMVLRSHYHQAARAS